MEEDGGTTPFWLQSNTYFSHGHHPRRRSSSICLNSGVLIVVLPVIALLFIVFVIPSIVSFTSQIVQPNLVKKSWSNLNLVLVVFAILCGIFARKNGEKELPNVTPVVAPPAEMHQSSQGQWFGYSDDRRVDDHDSFASNINAIRRLRSSSSYPDLRQESLWPSSNENYWRFSDDSDLYGSSSLSSVHRRHPYVEDSVIKTIPIDTFVVRSTNHESSTIQQVQPSPPSPPPPPALLLKEKAKQVYESIPQEKYEKSNEIRSMPQTPPPPPPPPVKQKMKHISQSVLRQHKNENDVFNEIRPMPQSSTPPPPLPPPPPEKRKSRSEHKGRSKSGAKDIASTLASLYHQRKRKNKQMSMENYDDILQSLSLNPASVFQQLFKKGSRGKRIRSLSPSVTEQAPHPPPPPPPPPPPQRLSKRKTYTEPQSAPPASPPPPPPPPPKIRKPLTPRRPPSPTKTNIFHDEDIISNSRNQSPLLPMPPPPPPPPFKMPEFKYVVRGDFVRLRSSHSSRSTSPDLDSVDTPPTTPQVNRAEAGVSVFCPSPDVDTKADTFIARFRAGLKLEKANSFNQKQELGISGPSQRKGSSLRPSPSPSPS